MDDTTAKEAAQNSAVIDTVLSDKFQNSVMKSIKLASTNEDELAKFVKNVISDVANYAFEAGFSQGMLHGMQKAIDMMKEEMPSSSNTI